MSSTICVNYFIIKFLLDRVVGYVPSFFKHLLYNVGAARCVYGFFYFIYPAGDINLICPLLILFAGKYFNFIFRLIIIALYL